MKSGMPSFPEIRRAPAIKSVMRRGCNKPWCSCVAVESSRRKQRLGLCREGDVDYDGLFPHPRRAAQGKSDRSLVSSQSRFFVGSSEKVLRAALPTEESAT